MRIEINIDDRIVHFFKRTFTRKKLIIYTAAFFFITTVFVFGAVDIPHTFEWKQVISSSQMNENFLALKSKIDEIESAINIAPVGVIMPYGGPSDDIPEGWLLCDGEEVSRVAYADLHAKIGSRWGAGDFSTTFNLPDLKGRFLRGVDGGRGVDPDAGTRVALFSGGHVGDNVGSYQDDEIKTHNHQILDYPLAIGNREPGGSNDYWYGMKTGITESYGGAETRPKNAAVNYIIKY